MTTQIVRFRTLSGRSLTCKMTQDDAVIFGSVVATEYENVTGVYLASFSDLPDGLYWFQAALPSGTVAEEGWVSVAGDGTYDIPSIGSVDVSSFSGPAQTYLNQQFESILDGITSAIGNIVVASVDLSTTDFPKSMRIGDARTSQNGAALTIRCYAADDTEYATPLLGVGSLLFEDATSLTLGFTLAGTVTPEVELPVQWVQNESDGFFLLEWNETALDAATPFERGSTKYHEWGIKVGWINGHLRTIVEGTTKLLPPIVSNP